MLQLDLKAIRFYAYHGLFAEEAKLGQEFTIDLQLQIQADQKALESDEMEGLLNYAEVLNQVEEVFTKQRFKLIETAALAILNSLAQFELIKSAQVTIHKPAAPVPQILDDISVTLSQDYA